MPETCIEGAREANMVETVSLHYKEHIGRFTQALLRQFARSSDVDPFLASNNREELTKCLAFFLKEYFKKRSFASILFVFSNNVVEYFLYIIFID